MSKKIAPDGGLRTSIEASIVPRLEKSFESRTDIGLGIKLDNFPKYIRRQRVTRYLALYELFKLALPIKGSIIECGVNEGFGLMSWANFSSVLEPNNLMRKIYGFDTFEGFTSITDKDNNSSYDIKKGDLKASSYEELQELVGVYDDNRFLGHVEKVKLIKGDICKTAIQFIKDNAHIVVSLLFMDLDIYEPTKAALETFVPRMPKGAILAFDELDNPIWPGETLAALECIGLNNLKLERLEFDPYISFCRIAA